jgi:hypothetical protein
VLTDTGTRTVVTLERVRTHRNTDKGGYRGYNDGIALEIGSEPPRSQAVGFSTQPDGARGRGFLPRSLPAPPS